MTRISRTNTHERTKNPWCHLITWYGYPTMQEYSSYREVQTQYWFVMDATQVCSNKEALAWLVHIVLTMFLIIEILILHLGGYESRLCCILSIFWSATDWVSGSYPQFLYIQHTCLSSSKWSLSILVFAKIAGVDSNRLGKSEHHLQHTPRQYPQCTIHAGVAEDFQKLLTHWYTEICWSCDHQAYSWNCSCHWLWDYHWWSGEVSQRALSSRQ